MTMTRTIRSCQRLIPESMFFTCVCLMGYDEHCPDSA
jgi:hypothetical protein